MTGMISPLDVLLLLALVFRETQWARSEFGEVGVKTTYCLH